MYTEIFEIEFQVMDVEERYITFELELYGGWIKDEVGGGKMLDALHIEEDFDYEFHGKEDSLHIRNWIAKNQHAIRKMFTERIKKYED